MDGVERGWEIKKIKKIIMGYYAGPILERDPPGVPLFGVLQYAKSLQGITRVHIFATNVRFIRHTINYLSTI